MDNENKGTMINEQAAAAEQAAEKAAESASETADTVKTEAVMETADGVKTEAENAEAACAETPDGGACAAPVLKMSRFAPLVVIVMILLALVAGTSLVFAVNNTMKITRVMDVMSDQWGMNIEALANGEIEAGKHPEYDDTAVVEAYKSGDSSKLSEKDKYVYDQVSAVIDEIITEDMSDYDKELAVFNWIFAHVRYNDQNFVDVEGGSEESVNAGEAEAEPEQQQGGNREETELNREEEPGEARESGEQASGNTAETREQMEERLKEEAEDDPIAKEDPYGENYDYEPYGVLKFRTGICVGKSTTFKLFMDILDIPCQLIHSTEEGEHCWNLVQIDGDWYHCDLTLDSGDMMPVYDRFNVTDTIKLEDGYPWDPTDFPAADSLEYCYMIRNAVEVDDLYALPQTIHDSMEEGKSVLFIKAGEGCRVSEEILDQIGGTLQNIFPYGSFYSYKLKLDDEHSVYVFQMDKGLNYADNETEEEDDYVEYDSDRLYESSNRAFADYYEQYAVG
ncbi:MAG: hypothetical protein K5767_04645 [Clostridia bacterium]|nr:hypothetical protein [Clostridia bacterium]